MKNSSSLVRQAIALACALASLPARAQTAAPATSAPDADATLKLETVIVSAQRRLEALQDVPVPVKAFSAKQIEAAGIKSTQDFINLTPNMSFDNSQDYANSFVALRGVTQISNADSPVAVVIDGVPQNHLKQLKMSLFDIERIEVLKGPQGALYGRNSIGGAINIETKPPGNKFEGFVDTLLGSGNLRELVGAVNSVLSENVAFLRIVGQTRHSDGTLYNSYLQRDIDGIDHDNSLRARLLLRPSSTLQVDLRASVNDYQAAANWDSIVRSGKPGDIVMPVESMYGRSAGRFTDFSAKLEAELRIGTLTSITAHTKFNTLHRGDIDFSNPRDLPNGFLDLGFQAGQFQAMNVRLTSQELRLASPAGQPLRWIGGFYYLDTHRGVDTRVYQDTNSQLDQADDAAKRIVTLNESNHNKASALFGQIDYDFSKQLTLSTALRYDSDQRQQTDLGGGGAEREARFSKWQPKFTLTNKLSRDALVYATLATGFRSGGFNAPGLSNFRPETLTNAELGSKNTLLGGRLIFNAAVFAARSKDFQFFYVDVGKGAQVISNIDKVDLKGVDVDFRYLPVKGLEFDGGLGLTDSTIKKSSDQPQEVGHRTPKSVPFKLNLGLQYSAAVAAGVEASMRLDYEHRDKKYWHPDNRAVSPPLDLLGLRVGLRDSRDRWSATLAAKNLANKRFYADYNSGRYSGLPYDIGSLAPGREMSLEARVSF